MKWDKFLNDSGCKMYGKLQYATAWCFQVAAMQSAEG